MTNGLLLINIGTPSAPTKTAVRQFLKTFLRDKRVIAVPALLRYLLVYGFILPFRSKKSTHAYQQIWQKEGAPLLTLSQQLVQKVQENLGPNWQVALSMRYGEPTITSALKKLSNCSNLVVLPLYPQYASSSTGSAIEYVLKAIGKQAQQPNLVLIRDFFQKPWFVEAFAAQIKPYINEHDFILMSYHGIPVDHLKPLGCTNPCVHSCPQNHAVDRACYRAQCQETTETLAKILNLSPAHYGFSFQSRLGKASWLEPYTEEYLTMLAQKGIKRLAIVCPSFVTDCLETLEEIGIRAQAQWLALGGECCTLIPCLNTSDLWVLGLSQVANSAIYAIENT